MPIPARCQAFADQIASLDRDIRELQADAAGHHGVGGAIASKTQQRTAAQAQWTPVCSERV
jgi:hypothetical protein